MLGDNAYLLEQLGDGHTSLAQRSSCTINVMLNYISSSTVGTVYYAHWLGIHADRFRDF